MEAAGACHPAKDFNHKRCALMVAGTGKDSEDAVTGGDVVYRELAIGSRDVGLGDEELEKEDGSKEKAGEVVFWIGEEVTAPERGVWRVSLRWIQGRG